MCQAISCQYGNNQYLAFRPRNNLLPVHFLQNRICTTRQPGTIRRSSNIVFHQLVLLQGASPNFQQTSVQPAIPYPITGQISRSKLCVSVGNRRTLCNRARKRACRSTLGLTRRVTNGAYVCSCLQPATRTCHGGDNADCSCHALLARCRKRGANGRHEPGHVQVQVRSDLNPGEDFRADQVLLDFTPLNTSISRVFDQPPNLAVLKTLLTKSRSLPINRTLKFIEYEYTIEAQP